MLASTADGPKNLNADEEEHARAQLDELADRFTESGDLLSPEWRDAS